MCGVEISAHIDALEHDGALLADAAEAAGLQARIPGCPGWQVRDLVRHQAYVHAWAARHVRERSPELLDEELTESDILGRGPADPDLIAAYRDGHAALVATLRDADPDLECVTFMPAPSPLAFWARRQAHETAIHRYDAQSALSGGPPAPAAAFGPAFAADGVDELIMGFAARKKLPPRQRQRRRRRQRQRRRGAVADRPRAGRRRALARPPGRRRQHGQPRGRPRRPRGGLQARRPGGRPLRVPLEPRRRRPGRPHHHRRPGDPGRLEHQRPRPLVAAATPLSGPAARRGRTPPAYTAGGALPRAKGPARPRQARPAPNADTARKRSPLRTAELVEQVAVILHQVPQLLGVR